MEQQVTERIWEDLEAEVAPEWAITPLQVLFATDGSQEAQAAARVLQKLPLVSGSWIQVLTVTAGAEWTMPEWFVAGEHAWGNKVAETAAHELERPGVEVVCQARSGAVAFEIIQAADEFEVDLVAVGSKGLTGVKGFFLGSVARNVAKHAHRSVLVGRELKNDLRHVVLAVDESAHATDAAHFLARLPLPQETEVSVVTVVPSMQPYAVVAPEFLVQYEAASEELRKQGLERSQQLVHGICERLNHRGKRAVPVVLEGDPAEEILAHCQRAGADLVVAGARGVSLIEGLLVGSVADRILNQAQCSVLLVR